MVEIKIKLNGREYQDFIPSDMMLIDYLRKRRLLTGTKKACGAGRMRRLYCFTEREANIFLYHFSNSGFRENRWRTIEGP